MSLSWRIRKLHQEDLERRRLWYPVLFALPGAFVACGISAWLFAGHRAGSSALGFMMTLAAWKLGEQLAARHDRRSSPTTAPPA